MHGRKSAPRHSHNIKNKFTRPLQLFVLLCLLVSQRTSIIYTEQNGRFPSGLLMFTANGNVTYISTPFCSGV